MEIVTRGTDDFTTYMHRLYKIQIRNTTQKWNANLLLKEWKFRKRIESGAYLGCEFSAAELLRDERERIWNREEAHLCEKCKDGCFRPVSLAPSKSEMSHGRLATCRPSRA